MHCSMLTFLRKHKPADVCTTLETRKWMPKNEIRDSLFKEMQDEANRRLLSGLKVQVRWRLFDKPAADTAGKQIDQEAKPSFGKLSR